jgi:hypothetical protein
LDAIQAVAQLWELNELQFTKEKVQDRLVTTIASKTKQGWSYNRGCPRTLLLKLPYALVGELDADAT